MKPLVLIPARGGSKGIPGKNIKPLNGKPLIHYTIEAAIAVFPLERIFVSSDDEAILSSSRDAGVQNLIKRPDELSTDTASSYDVIRHIMNLAENNDLEFDTVVLLQATSPFRNAEHLREAVELYSNELDMLVSVKIADENPYYSLFEENSAGYLNKSKEGNYTRRQDCPEVYAYNGAIYIMNRVSLEKNQISEFKKIRKYIMPNSTSIDLDTPLDWKIAEVLMQEGLVGY